MTVKFADLYQVMTVKFADLYQVLIAAWRGLFPGCERYLHPDGKEMQRQVLALCESKKDSSFPADKTIRDTCEAWLALYKSGIENGG